LQVVADSPHWSRRRRLIDEDTLYTLKIPGTRHGGLARVSGAAMICRL
jgi:hypothetical protein